MKISCSSVGFWIPRTANEPVNDSTSSHHPVRAHAPPWGIALPRRPLSEAPRSTVLEPEATAGLPTVLRSTCVVHLPTAPPRTNRLPVRATLVEPTHLTLPRVAEGALRSSADLTTNFPVVALADTPDKATRASRIWRRRMLLLGRWRNSSTALGPQLVPQESPQTRPQGFTLAPSSRRLCLYP